MPEIPSSPMTPEPELLCHLPPEPRRAAGSATSASTDTKVIGIQYIVTAFFFFLIGGLLAMVIAGGCAGGGSG